mmetsp:Transcript_8843/g.25238  ORF Transcript_8843/g.25238 Transcript_8843/m.25238 type:complete len:237 (+) Transcript_8843:1285-1995(+)
MGRVMLWIRSVVTTTCPSRATLSRMLMVALTVSRVVYKMFLLLGLHNVKFFFDGGFMRKELMGISSKCLLWSKFGDLQTWIAKATGKPCHRGAFSAVTCFLNLLFMLFGQFAYTSSSWQHSANRRASSGLAKAKNHRFDISCSSKETSWNRKGMAFSSTLLFEGNAPVDAGDMTSPVGEAPNSSWPVLRMETLPRRANAFPLPPPGFVGVFTMSSGMTLQPQNLCCMSEMRPSAMS